MYSIKIMDNITAEQIIDWHYTEPYHFYDLTSNNTEFQIWENNLNNNDWKDTYSINDNKDIIGFFKLSSSDSIVNLKLGINPSFTGKKLGTTIIQDILQFITDKYKNTASEINVSIVSFNKRAIKLFISLGFETVKHIPQSINGVPYDYTILKKSL